MLHHKRTNSVVIRTVSQNVDSIYPYHQMVQGVALAAELPKELLSAITALRGLAARAEKEARKPSSAAEAAGQQRAFAALARWLQLYLLGDPEALDADLADELTGIHADAFAKSGVSGRVHCFRHRSRISSNFNAEDDDLVLAATGTCSVRRNERIRW